MKNMKRTFNYLLGFAAMLGMVTLIGCEGPEGPAGADGIDGADGDQNCITCHNENADLDAKQIQWAASGHATGSTFERNTEDCASCHTQQGFQERLLTGEMDNGEVIDPAPHTCRSCHNIHQDYAATDFSLANNDVAATSLIDGTTSFDFGNGSLCAYCHQGRDPGDMTGTEFAVTSPYWGVHHGPQANIYSGTGAYDFGTPYSVTNKHASLTDACVDCHMAEPYGSQAGGHTFNMTYEYHGSNAVWDAGCVECHSDVHSKIDELTAEVQPKLEEIATLLIADSLLSDSDQAVPGTYATDDAGALMNYLMINEDRSMGVHNPDYVNAVLDATLTYLNSK